MAKSNKGIEDIYHLHGKNREYVKGDFTGELSAGDIDTGFRHSGHYHDFFEGYTEVKKIKANGKYTIERFYTDDWIVCQRPEKKKFYMVAYWMLYIASIAIVVFSAAGKSLSNSHLLGAASIGIFIVMAVLMLMPLVKYVTSGTRMTLHNYKISSKRLIIYSIIAGSAAAFAAIGGFIIDLIGREGVTENADIVSRLLLLLLAAFLMGVIAFLEKGFKYTKETNKTKVEEEGFKIR